MITNDDIKDAAVKGGISPEDFDTWLKERTVIAGGNALIGWAEGTERVLRKKTVPSNLIDGLTMAVQTARLSAQSIAEDNGLI